MRLGSYLKNVLILTSRSTNLNRSLQCSRCLSSALHPDHAPSRDNVQDNLTRLKMLLPIHQGALRAILGPEKVHLRELESRSHTKITVSSRKDRFPGTQNRVLMVEGSKSGIIHAMGEICGILNNVELPSDKSFSDEVAYQWIKRDLRLIKLVFPQSLCGKVVGLSGENLRKLCSENSLNIYLAKSGKFDQIKWDIDETFICFEGETEDLRKASKIILDLLEAKENLTLSDNLSYLKVHKQSQAAPNPRVRAKILIPNFAVGCFIGDHGQLVNKLKSDLKCIIRVSDPGEFFPTPGVNPAIDRVILIDGPREGILKVIEKVKGILETATVPEKYKLADWESKSRELRMLVPTDWGRELFANKMEKLGNIHEIESLEHMCLVNNEDSTGLNETIVVMRGRNEDVFKVGDALLGLMSEDDGKCIVHSDLNYKKFHLSNDDLEDSASDPSIKVKILIPPYVIPRLMGTRGNYIRDIMEETNCIMKVSEYGQTFPGTSERVLLIRGVKDNVMNALEKIREVQKSVDAPPNIWARKNNGLQMVVSRNLAHMLLSNNGEMLHKIQVHDSLEHIRVNFNQSGASKWSSEEAILTMRGDDESLLRSGEFILRILSANDYLGITSTDLNYQQYHPNVPKESKQTNPNQFIKAKILIPDYTVPIMIGTSGATIKQLQAETNCTVKISKNGHSFPGTLERVLLIRGLKKNVVKAIRKIKEIQETVDIPHHVKLGLQGKDKNRCLKIVVPSSYGEELVWNDGDQLRKIKTMQSLHSTRLDKRHVQASKSELDEAILYLEGENENLLRAGSYVLGVMSDREDEFDLSTNLDYRKFYVQNKEPLGHFTLTEKVYD